jgi:5-methylcytosine-specific restriction endonuclease McrA
VEHVHPLVVLEMDDGVCGICGEDVDPFGFEVDHIIPLVKAGEHSYANAQPAHKSCNASKNDRILYRQGDH